MGLRDYLSALTSGAQGSQGAVQSINDQQDRATKLNQMQQLRDLGTSGAVAKGLSGDTGDAATLLGQVQGVTGVDKATDAATMQIYKNAGKLAGKNAPDQPVDPVEAQNFLDPKGDPTRKTTFLAGLSAKQQTQFLGMAQKGATSASNIADRDTSINNADAKTTSDAQSKFLDKVDAHTKTLRDQKEALENVMTGVQASKDANGGVLTAAGAAGLLKGYTTAVGGEAKRVNYQEIKSYSPQTSEGEWAGIKNFLQSGDESKIPTSVLGHLEDTIQGVHQAIIGKEAAKAAQTISKYGTANAAYLVGPDGQPNPTLQAAVDEQNLQVKVSKNKNGDYSVTATPKKATGVTAKPGVLDSVGVSQTPMWVGSIQDPGERSQVTQAIKGMAPAQQDAIKQQLIQNGHIKAE